MKICQKYKSGKCYFKTLCIMLHFGYALCFCCRLLIFFKNNFVEKVFQEYHHRWVSHILAPGQDQRTTKVATSKKWAFIGILGQVWYLIVSIPDLCTLTYFDLPSLSVGLGELSVSLPSLLLLSDDLSSDMSLCETKISTTWLFSFLIGTMSSKHLKWSPEK